MPDLFRIRRPGRTLALALLLAAVTTGCGLLPVEQEGPTATDDRPAAAPAEPGTAGTDAPDTRSESSTEAETSAPSDTPQGLHIARSGQAEHERRAALREQGHETLASTRLGYYMDVLGARLRQELAGQPAVIDREDAGIRVSLPQGDDPARALDTIGRLLDEFRASLVTVIAHHPGTLAGASDHSPAEDAALAAGRRLEGAGVAPERLILRIRDAAEPGADLDNEERAPKLELVIQPLTTT